MMHILANGRPRRLPGFLYDAPTPMEKPRHCLKRKRSSREACSYNSSLVVIPELRQLQLAAEEARKKAIDELKDDRSKAMSTLIVRECLEAKSRAIRKEWCLKLASDRHFPSAGRENISRSVRFSDDLQIIGYADPRIDRRPIECSPPSVAERLVLRAARIFPHREIDGAISY